jgi:hypothetical protein
VDALKYAAWNGSAWEIQFVDFDGDTGDYSCLAFDSAGRPGISYRDYLSGQLRYAHWSGSSWDRRVISMRGGCYSSLDYDAQDNPHVAFKDTVYGLSLTYRDGTSWSTDIIGDNCFNTSLDLDNTGRPHIAYGLSVDGKAKQLKYAFREGGSWEVLTVDEAYEGYWSPSLRVDSAGDVHLAYGATENLIYAQYDGESWNHQRLDTGSTGTGRSLVLDDMGFPHIAYCGSPSLKYATWDGTDWVLETVDPVVGQDMSIAVDKYGRVHIAYYDSINRDLRYALGVPEPATLALLAAGAAVVAVWRRRRWESVSWPPSPSMGDMCSALSL